MICDFLNALSVTLSLRSINNWSYSLVFFVLPLGTELLLFYAYGDKKQLFECKGSYFDLEDVTGFSGVTLDLIPVLRQNLALQYIQGKYYGQGRCFHFLPPENSLKFCINMLVAIVSICAVTDSLFCERAGLKWNEHTSGFRGSYGLIKNKRCEVVRVGNHHQLLSPVAGGASQHNSWMLVFQGHFFAWIYHHILYMVERPAFFEKGSMVLNN